MHSKISTLLPMTLADVKQPTWFGVEPIVIILIVVGVLFFLLRTFQNRGKSSVMVSDDEFRHTVANNVLNSAIWGTVVIAALAIASKGERNKEVLSLLLPVFGTWIGTLLAYYFGKDNYESGARNSEKLTKALTGMDRLRSIAASSVMIRLDQIEIPAIAKDKGQADYKSIVLKELLNQMTRERLPLIDPVNKTVIGIVHKSLLNAFIVRQAPDKQATISLEDMLKDPNEGAVAKKSYAIIQLSATLAEAKEAIERQTSSSGTQCEDVFITTPGTDKVEGWITNDIIIKNSQA